MNNLQKFKEDYEEIYGESIVEPPEKETFIVRIALIFIDRISYILNKSLKHGCTPKGSILMFINSIAMSSFLTAIIIGGL